MMNSDKDSGIPHTHDNSRVAGKAVPRAVFAIVVVALVIAAVALPGLVSEDQDAPQVTEASTPAVSTVTPTPEQALSPQALEDLRTDPTINLTIDPQPLLLELLPEEDSDVTAADEPVPEIPEETTPDSSTESFSVGEALARYLLAIRTELDSEYVANCIRHRNRNGAGADCPDNPALAADNLQQERALVDELFAIITRDDDYARISSRLARENETLAAILDDPDNPAALQASTKMALNNSYLSYLNGNPSPAVTAFNTMNDFINDYNRTIIAGPTQFRCQDGPCVYEYTGAEEE